MSAPNFYSNAGTVFAVDDDQAEFIEDMEAGIVEQLRAKGLDVDEVRDEYDDNRSYGGRYFARINGKHQDDAFEVVGALLTRGGYYSGANFDYEVKLYDANSGEYIDMEEATPEDLAAILEDYHGEKRAHKQLWRRACSEAEQIKAAIIAAYKQNSQPLTRVATFSNGEAVYQAGIVSG